MDIGSYWGVSGTRDRVTLLLQETPSDRAEIETGELDMPTRTAPVFALQCILLVTLSVASSPEKTEETASAQEQVPYQGKPSRADQLLQLRKQRLSTVKPAKKSKIIDLLTTVENDGFDQIVTFQARHWRFGFGKISPVSGGTPAVQYERPRLAGSQVRLRADAAYSLRGYQAYNFRLGWFDEPGPDLHAGHGFLGAPFEFDRRTTKSPRNFLYADLGYRNHPKEEFFGLGSDSQEGDRSDYGLEQGSIDAVAGLQPTRWLGLRFRVGYLPTDIVQGENDALANLGDQFDPIEAPGLEAQPEFLHLNSGLYLVWEGDPNLPAAGLGINFSRYNDLDLDRYAFNRFSVDARGTLPLGSRQRSIAARFFASRDSALGGHQVPFYLMDTLGGNDTLRGYRNFRFRDENILYFSGEYRWEATTGVELAAFYDTGKVFPDRSGFTFEHLKHSFGGGIRGKSMRRVVFRLEVGRSQEGTFVYISAGPSF